MIRIKDLHVEYDEKEVVHGLDAEFPDGKITVIIGPNGCGKSTTVKSIMRLEDRTKGTIEIDGKDIDSISQKDLAREVAYVSQSKNIADISVYNLVLHGRFPYLSYPRHYRKEDKDKVAEALRLTGMTDYADRKLESLSGGQRQKVYMAMALAQDTKTIIMDEPTTFLDVKNQFEMMDHAKSLKDMGKTIIMILHDFEAVLHYADKVILMNDGKDILSGTAEEVLKSKELEEVFGVHAGFFEAEDSLHIYLKS